MSAALSKAPLERWGTKKLKELVLGSSRSNWLLDWIPYLVRIGVLRKVGQQWLGRRDEIEAGLLAAPTSKPGKQAQGGPDEVA